MHARLVCYEHYLCYLIIIIIVSNASHCKNYYSFFLPPENDFMEMLKSCVTLILLTIILNS